MGESIYRGFTVGYLVALSLIAMTWLLAWLYIRVSNRQHTALQGALGDRVGRRGVADAGPPQGRKRTPAAPIGPRRSRPGELIALRIARLSPRTS
jgi:hypothetical protein